jgi:hypothetical protein
MDRLPLGSVHEEDPRAVKTGQREEQPLLNLDYDHDPELEF